MEPERKVKPPPKGQRRPPKGSEPVKLTECCGRHEMLCECKAEQHRQEAARIQSELDGLGPGFAEDGVVRTVLRARVEQEKARAEEEES